MQQSNTAARHYIAAAKLHRESIILRTVQRQEQKRLEQK
jgi:hypothetical protein